MLKPCVNVIVIVIINIVLLSSSSFCQSLYMPLEIKYAYDTGTRSYDGKPGPNYWQNRSEYTIKVSVEPATRLLSGSETIIYHNNSPDTLSQLVVRLYQDVHKSTSAHDFSMSSESFTDGVILKSLSVGGTPVDLNDHELAERYGTNLFVKPGTAVGPMSSVDITVQWEFTIPKNGLRMGAYDSTSFLIAYWFPQISVYDDIDGWDWTNYTGTVEFYNDFSDFDVEISVPDNYCVWATGILQNPGKVLRTEYLTRYNLALTSDSVIHIIAKQDLTGTSQLTVGNPVWHFKAENVPDFAFAFSSNYLWDAVSYNNVLISAAYDPSSQDFYEFARLSRRAVQYFSEEFPAVPFPYPRMTVFNGSGGMEFPMMVNQGSSDSRSGAVFTLTHEISHTYFPFYMGINERKYAWMDEGWAQALPMDLQKELVPESDRRAVNVFRYLNTAGTMGDVPIMTHSGNAGNYSTYAMVSYFKPGCAYDILRSTLGKEIFDEALREFMKRWHGKHPIPYDFFFTFDDVVSPLFRSGERGEGLGWYWKPWFFETAYPDLGIIRADIKGQKVSVTLEMVGRLPLPVDLKLITADFDTVRVTEPASFWNRAAAKNDGHGARIVSTIEIEVKQKLTSIKLGNPYIPDVDVANNTYIVK